VPYSELGVADPLAYAFAKLHLTKLSGIIAFSAVIAMAGVLLVFQVGQPRIWMSMSRDGLLPPIFSRLHKKYRTPFFATIIAGIIVAVPSLFLNLTEVTDLTSIGTLFAFILVSGGILILNPMGKDTGRGFRVPYLNSRWYLLPLWALIFIVLYFTSGKAIHGFFFTGEGFFNLIYHQFPFFIFLGVSVWITVMAIIRQWSLIPALGLLTNLYLMSELGITNWLRFLIWLVVGLLLFFSYGSKHSLLRKRSENQEITV
jgi:basic amino acid/polyamine antiporter, APA family